MCTGNKNTFATQSEALTEIKHIKRGNCGQKAKLSTYHCKYCEGWHLTSQSKKQARSKRRKFKLINSGE